MSLSHDRAFRRALTAAAAALVAGAWLAVATPPVAAGAASGGAGRPVLRLRSQSQWVAPSPSQPGGPAKLTLDLSASGAPPGAVVTVTLYSKLQNRSTFEATLHTSPGQVGGESYRDRTAPVAVSKLPRGPDGGADLQVAVVPSHSTGTAPPSPSLDLRCTFAAVLCTGVYPVVVALETSSGGELSHFTTYLTYAAHGTTKLHFAWVVPLAARTSIEKGATDPAHYLNPPSAQAAAGLEQLIAQLRTTGVPVTLEPSAQTLQALEESGASKGKAAVKTLRNLSANQSVDQTVTEGYVPVDLGTLAAAGEPTEIRAQVTAAVATLKDLGVQPGDGATWIATGRVGAAIGTGLAQVGATHVVVPDDQLASATIDYTWASTFQLALGGDHTVAAAAADGVLSSQFAAVHGDPALAATRLLADLAMVHFEQPSNGRRGLVAVPPSDWQPTARFDSTLLRGLQGNPVVQPVTLSGFFSSVAKLDGEPTRHLASSGEGPSLSGTLAQKLSAARLQLTAFERAVAGDPPTLAALGQALLAAEASYRGQGGMAAEVAAFTRLLAHQVSLVKLSTDRSVTLTARTGWIPITVVSGASYPIKGTLTVSGAKFKFPQGATRPLELRHPTNSARVHVVARTLGDSPVTVSFTAPGGGLVFDRVQLTVRSTATSVVGVVLTATALAILLGWWARTWWSGRRRRRAALAASGRGA